jgi:hypothetical protein
MSIRRKLGTLLLLLGLVGGTQTVVSAQSVEAHRNRIVGLWDVQVTVKNCSTGATLGSFPALHKYELGGTGQVVPATNLAGLSAHMTVWSHVRDNRYRMTVKMFRFDSSGNNIGWAVIKNNIAINEDATGYAGLGRAEVFDSNGNSLGTSCAEFTGTRFVEE